MCQQCVIDGALSQTTFDRIEAFNEEWPDASHGPAHIVLDDDNVFDANLTWCIGLCDAVLLHDTSHLNEEDTALVLQLRWWEDHDLDEVQATRLFLKELLLTSEVDR